MNPPSSNILQRNLEEENQLREDELYDRVGKLKSLSLEIRDYIQTEKSSLNKLNKDYDTSNDMIKNTLNKVQDLIKTGLAKNTCYLIVVVIVFLFILYFIS